MPQYNADCAAVTMVSLRLSNCHLSLPSTEMVEAILRSQTRRGLTVAMPTPFIDNQHIMMSMPDGKSCSLEVTFPNTDQPVRSAQVRRFYKEKEDGNASAWFVVELEYIPGNSAPKHSKIWEPFRRKAGQIIRGGENLD